MLVKNQTFHDLVFKDMNNRNEHDCQNLAPQVLECFYFCNSMFPSHDHDCKDFAFQVLKLFGVNNFNTKRLLRISFMTQDLVFQDTNTIGFVFFGIFATTCPQVLTIITQFKTWFSKSWFFSGKVISTLDACQE